MNRPITERDRQEMLWWVARQRIILGIKPSRPELRLCHQEGYNAPTSQSLRQSSAQLCLDFNLHPPDNYAIL